MEETTEETDYIFDPSEAAEAVETAEDFRDRILSISGTSSTHAQHFSENFIFYDKSLEEWSRQLQVAVPQSPTPQQLQGLYIELANNLQIAGHFKAVANSIYSALSSGMKIQRDDLINALVNHHLRANVTRPAAKVLESMADSYMKDSTISRESAKLAKDFWTQKYDALIEVRKCLEQLNMSIITEHKYAGGNEEL